MGDFFGGGSTTTNTQKTTSTSEPWSEAQPYMKYGLGQADKLYKSGVGAMPFTGSTVVPYAQQTTNAMDALMAKSDAAQGGMIKPFDALQSQIDVLNPIAKGDFSNDTTFMNTLGRAQQDASNAVNMGASAAGRYGSAVHQGNVAREVGDLTNRAMLQRQDWAQNNLLNVSNALPAAYNTALQPEQTQMGVGSMYEDLMGRQMGDELRMFNESQNLPWENLARYNAIVSGAGALGGTSTSKASVQTPKDYGSVFGNALTGYAYGGIPGALLGGASGLF